MKSISFVLTLLLSSALAAPFESTYSSLSAREEAGLFDDLKGGSLGPRASDDTVTKATDDLDKFLASLRGKGDVKVPSKREEALLGLDGLLDGLLGGVTGGSGAVGGAAKGATDAVGGAAGGLTKDLKEKLGDVTGGAGDLTKDLADKLDGLTGKGSDKQKREEALIGDFLGLLNSLTGGATSGLTKELKEKLGDVTDGAGDLTKDVTDKLDGLTGKGSDKQKREEAVIGDLLSLLSGLTGGVTGGTGAVGGLTKGLTDTVDGATGGLTKGVTDKLDGLTGKGSDKQKREEAFVGDLLGLISSLAGSLTGGVRGSGPVGGLTEELKDKLDDVTGSAGDLTKGVTDKLDGLTGKGSDKRKREEALAGLPIPIEDLLKILGLGKRGEEGLSKREETIAKLPIDIKDLAKLLKGLGLGKREEAIAGLPDSIEDLLKLLGLDKRGEDDLSKREEAIAGLPNLEDLVDLLKKLGLGKKDVQQLSEREVAGIGRILSLNLLPLSKGSGKRDVAEGSSVDRRDPIALTPEIIEALLRQKLEHAKKGKDEIKDKASGKDKREMANHQSLDDVTDEVKELLEALLGGAGKLPDSIKKTVEDKVGDVKDVAKDASGKAKDAVAAVDPSA